MKLIIERKTRLRATPVTQEVFNIPGMNLTVALHNDDPDLDTEERELKIKEVFAQHGIEVEFV